MEQEGEFPADSECQGFGGDAIHDMPCRSGAAFTFTEKELLMRALLTGVAVVVAALFVGCSQPIAPTSPTSTLSGGPSITSPGGNPTSTGIPREVAARGL